MMTPPIMGLRGRVLGRSGLTDLEDATVSLATMSLSQREAHPVLAVRAPPAVAKNSPHCGVNFTTASSARNPQGGWGPMAHLEGAALAGIVDATAAN